MISAMPPDFDPVKDQANRRKHELSLSFGQRIFEDPAHIVLPSTREVDREERFKIIGAAHGNLYTAVYTMRANRPRFISVRRSNRHEERNYRHLR